MRVTHFGKVLRSEFFSHNIRYGHHVFVKSWYSSPNFQSMIAKCPLKNFDPPSNLPSCSQSPFKRYIISEFFLGFLYHIWMFSERFCDSFIRLKACSMIPKKNAKYWRGSCYDWVHRRYHQIFLVISTFW